ncbi:hypothetical protein D3C72_1286390 [compost metagenome]
MYLQLPLRVLMPVVILAGIFLPLPVHHVTGSAVPATGTIMHTGVQPAAVQAVHVYLLYMTMYSLMRTVALPVRAKRLPLTMVMLTAVT